MDQEIRNYENNQELSDDQLDNIVGGFSTGDVVTLRPRGIKYCPNCARLLCNAKVTITGVRGVLDGSTVYWVTHNCCGHKSTAIDYTLSK